MLFASTSLFLSSCTDDSETVPPTITVSPATASVKQGDKASFTVTVSSNEDLVDLTVSGGAINPATGSAFVADAAIKSSTATSATFASDKTSVTVKYDFVVDKAIAKDTKITVTFTVKDKKTTNTGTAEITVVAGAAAINSWTATIYGGNSTAGGSYCVSSDGTVYKEADAKTNSAKVDLVYYYATSAGLYAPNDATLTATYTGWASAATKNATKFGATSITVAEFDAATDDAKITTAAASATATKVDVAVDKVYVFKTADNRLGLIKVKSITGNNSGTIVIEGKVQKAAAAAKKFDGQVTLAE